MLNVDILDAIKTKLNTNTSYSASYDEIAFHKSLAASIKADTTKIYMLVTDDKVDLSDTMVSGHTNRVKGELSIEMYYLTTGKTFYQYRKALEDATNTVIGLLLNSAYPQTSLGLKLYCKDSAAMEILVDTMEVTSRILTFTYEKL